ncbi:MAG: response regulator [Chloroflexi bacterium]|nr:response regulator [Chloroflexota bacterium]
MPTKANILVVEDEALVALDITSILTSKTYTVPATADTSARAVELAEKFQPDLVLMDIRLQDGPSGIEAANLIRTHFGIPVIFLTAHADEATIQKAKRALPYGYILKPFNENELVAAIEIALYRSQTEDRGQVVRDETLVETDEGTQPGMQAAFQRQVNFAQIPYTRLPVDSTTPRGYSWRIALVPARREHEAIGIHLLDEITIGRHDPDGLTVDLDLTPFDAATYGVSRQHAMIKFDAHNLYLHDIGSVNGSFVNFTRAFLGRPLTLHDLDVISFGKLFFQLKVIEKPTSNETTIL